ncbi:hypothetical protein ACFL2Q_11865 [Thermodesulfobacteriota bacterium]
MNDATAQEAATAEERKAELRRITKEIESQVADMLVRKNMVSIFVLEEILELYPLDESLVEKVGKLKGVRFHQLRQKVFELLAKTGKTVSDEVVSKRISELIERHLASMPRGGRPRKTR